MLLPLVMLALSAASCVSVDRRILSMTVTPSARPPDFSVLSKSTYNGGEAGKTGRYVTIMRFGARTETAVSDDCYDKSIVGQVLSVDCR